MEAPDTFGQWLKLRRKELDLTREELAGRAACSPETIKKIETGERRPSRSMPEMLARFA
jgi:transcriptional regulator with XRE-family HTH domain